MLTCFLKLKCSRDQPICTRCQKFRSNCVYPTRLDRRRQRLEARASSRDIHQSPRSNHVAAACHRDGGEDETPQNCIELRKFPAGSTPVERANAGTPRSTTRQIEKPRGDSPDVFLDSHSLENWANVSSEVRDAATTIAEPRGKLAESVFESYIDCA